MKRLHSPLHAPGHLDFDNGFSSEIGPKMLTPNTIPNANSWMFVVAIPEGVVDRHNFNCDLGEAQERFLIQVQSHENNEQLMLVLVEPSFVAVNHVDAIIPADIQSAVDPCWGMGMSCTCL
jgi:hypothetical protein